MFHTRHGVFRARRLVVASRMSRTSKERNNLSFLLVLMFFSVFGVIVLTEVFLVDERGRGQGVLVRHGAPTRQRSADTRPDYEDPPVFQPDDYLQYGGALLRGPGAGVGLGLRPGPGLGPGPGPGLTRERGQAPPSQGPPPNPPGGATANLTAQDGAWQIVSGTRYKFLVFSAYFDKRDGNRMIRIIGATRTRVPERVLCRFWYPPASAQQQDMMTVPARVKVIRENWNLKYSACFVQCTLRPNQSVPSAVSVVARPRVRPHNLLRVRDTQPAYTDPGSLGVCVKPLHFKYNRPLEMLEFLELNSLLGANHFTFYNSTIGPQVSCILHDYAARGMVTLLPWKLNMESQREIRTEGLFAAFNDCLYRNMPRHALVALIDLDEYIVPRHNDTLADLLLWLSKRLNTRMAGSFSFQNAFFYLQWPDDQGLQEHGVESRLLTARKTIRRTNLNPHKQRSKYICRPEFVVEAGNHFVWEFLPGHGAINVHPSAAMLHHYRVCEFGGNDCVKSAHTVDRTAHRYKDRLAARVAERWAALRERCQLGDLLPAAPNPVPAMPSSTSAPKSRVAPSEQTATEESPVMDLLDNNVAYNKEEGANRSVSSLLKS